MSCKTCAYPKPLCFAVYCKKDPELRDLPASLGHIGGPPVIQEVAPSWCPLAQQPNAAATPCA